MITPSTAALALSAAKTLIKFAGRLDRLLAEKVALRSELTLVLPTVRLGVGGIVIKRRLRQYLEETTPAQPGALPADRREEVARAVDAGDLPAMERFFRILFPSEALEKSLSPDQALLDFLQASVPSLRATLPATLDSRSDPESREAHEYLCTAQLLAAFQVDSGSDDRQLGYPVRIGLLVADVLAEFGTENAQLLVRDDSLRSVLESVVTRFAEPDLESFDSWSPFLRHALKATLNGAFDASGSLRGISPWVDALLEALSQARQAAGEQGDDYLLGLFRGEGYPLLISHGLAQAAATLNANSAAPAFQKIAAEFLNRAAPLVKPGSQFESFFTEHWSDLLRAGLQATAVHGEKLMEGKSPLLQRVLITSITTLSEVRGTRFLDRATLLSLAEGVLAAVATQPDLWDDEVRDPWLRELLGSIMATVQQLGVKSSLTLEGARSVLQNAAATFVEHPEWFTGDQSTLFPSVVGGILKKISEVPLPAAHAKSLAQAAIEGTLAAIAENAHLADLPFAPTIAALAGMVAARVNTGDLTASRGSAILHAATQSARLHPELFSNPRAPIAAILINVVLDAAEGDHGTLLAGNGTVDVTQRLLRIVATHGRPMLENASTEAIASRLATIVDTALEEASEALGNGLTLDQFPAALGAVVATWLKSGNPKSPAPSLDSIVSQLPTAFAA